MSKQFYFRQFSLAFSMSKTILFQTTQFSIIAHFSSIWPTDRILNKHFICYLLFLFKYSLSLNTFHLSKFVIGCSCNIIYRLHHDVLLARISLTLSRHFSLSSIALAGLQGYILYPNIAAVSMFELVVQLLPGHMWGSIGVHHLWARPCSSSNVLHIWFVWLG